MAFKFIAFASLVVAASAGILRPNPVVYKIAQFSAHLSQSHPAPAAYAAPKAQAWQAAPTTESYWPAEPKYEESYNHHPKYNFAYDVHDSHTGDLKNQQESRDGDVVKGSYSFIEADGSRRVVHYSADDHHGFNAIVEKQTVQAAPTTAAPEHVAYVTPIVYQQVAPVAHYSQSVSYSHAPQHYHY